MQLEHGRIFFKNLKYWDLLPETREIAQSINQVLEHKDLGSVFRNYMIKKKGWIWWPHLQFQNSRLEKQRHVALGLAGQPL